MKPTSRQSPLIELVDVTKTYVNGELMVEVLHGISLRVYPGEFVAIMGASGSGKSTLMNLLGCLDRPTTGQYLFSGEDVSTLEPDDLARLRRNVFGFIFQNYNLIATATAAENVEVPAIYAGAPSAERHERAVELLCTLGLDERLGHRPNQLSGGQQQRVSIARALMNGGQVILADEPTGALDSHTGAEVMGLLRQLSEDGHTVILITHDREVAQHADRLIEIKDGVVVGDTGPSIRPGSASVELVTEDAGDGAVSVAVEAAEAVKMAFRSLRANLFRTILTLLGIVIGVGSVVVMLAVGDGAKQAVLDQIAWLGTNLLLVNPGAPNVRGSGGVVTLIPDDAEAIAELPHVVAAVPDVTGSVSVRFGNVDYTTLANAISVDLPTVRDWPVARGSFFTHEDVRRYATVAVLGQTALANLFPPDTDPIGRYILIKNVPFQVIGVMTQKGATPSGSDLDDVVFVPLTTGMLRLFGRRHLRTITVQVDHLANIEPTAEAIRSLLIQRHRVEDFRIRNMAAIVETASETQSTLTVLLGSIAAISLLVGGIGVMNIMLVSVTERTREIGIRMASGARTANILQQFITEAVVVSAIGGIIGVVGGLAVAWGLTTIGTAIKFTVAPVILAFGCAFLTGLIFGYMPARKAAHLDPVVALSAE